MSLGDLEEYLKKREGSFNWCRISIHWTTMFDRLDHVLLFTDLEQSKLHHICLDDFDPHFNHVTSSKQADTLICHTTMHRNSINFLYNPGHVSLWCLEVVPVANAREGSTKEHDWARVILTQPYLYTTQWQWQW